MAHQCWPDMLALLERPEDPADYTDKPEVPTFTNWPELVEVLQRRLALQRVGLDQGALGHNLLSGVIWLKHCIGSFTRPPIYSTMA